MGSQTSGQKQSKKFTTQAVGTLSQGKSDMLSNPLYNLGVQIARDYAQNPSGFDPALIAQMKAMAQDSALGGQREAQRVIGERAGGSGNYRSGMTGQMQNRLALQGGQQVADALRQIDIQVAMSKAQNTPGAMAALQALLGQQYQWDRDIAGAYTGAASNPIWQQPSPWAQVGGGLGKIAGVVGGTMLGGPMMGSAIGGAMGGGGNH